jgi:hypothetical protein
LSEELVIWKFPLRPWSIFLDVPRGARVLSVGAQDREVVAWATVDPDAPRRPRILSTVPTGAPVPPALKGAQFIGTVQMNDGLVFHVFDGGEGQGPILST